MKGVFWELLEAAGGGDVEKVLASTTKAYSRKAYGEKGWKAVAEYLVKKYGAEKAVKIMHHKAMRTAHDSADKRDVRGLVAAVDSTVLSWPVKDILAELDKMPVGADLPPWWTDMVAVAQSDLASARDYIVTRK